MRIAIGVHGRFSAFSIADGLLQIGEDVRLFTNYPPSVAQRFGVDRRITRGFVAHGVATRVAGRIFPGSQPETVEAILHRSFGKWFRTRLNDEAYDVAFCWSGVAEESFNVARARKVLNRSSMHIRAQHDLLAEESHRAGRKIDMPSQWRIDREEREYALSDVIIVPSRFAAASFEGRVAAERIAVVPLTASAARWRPEQHVVEERVRRIEAGEKLRVLFVGAVSFQKGLFDLAHVVKKAGGSISFRFTGTITAECRDLVAGLATLARFDGHVPETQLRESYEWADILVCPSIQDGFAVVLAHAQAAGVPFIASTNTGGADLLEMGGKGWVVPIRAPEAIETQLSWCDANRSELADIVRDLYAHPVQREWKDVATEVVRAFGVVERSKT